MIHELKTWPGFFNDVLIGTKTFEVRMDDRNFQVGDVLILCGWDPVREIFTGMRCSRAVTYKLPGGQFGIQPGYCVLGLEPKPQPQSATFDQRSASCSMIRSPSAVS